MKIGYIKTFESNNSIKEHLKYFFYKIFNIVKQEKQTFIIAGFNKKIERKLNNLLIRSKFDYVVTEESIKINYPTISGKMVLKYFLPEIAEYCLNTMKLKIEEIYVCSNKFTKENCELIEELAQKIKVVNIITNNSQYNILEKELEAKGIYITVSSNKSKSLKNANIVINLDFDSFKEYNINRDFTLIDLKNNTKLPKAFKGTIIREINVNTKKVMRVFSEFENFDKSKLIEAEIIKLDQYLEKREFIRKNNIFFNIDTFD